MRLSTHLSGSTCRALGLVCGLVLLSSCRSAAPQKGSPRLVTGHPTHRASLFDPLLALEGRWVFEDSTDVIEYSRSSGGSALREVMFPGAEHEMTNMYTLDGDAVVMTHYCAAGNQPRMRANKMGDRRLDFHFEDISDLNAEDEVYMGELSIVWVDSDHIEQHWRSFLGAERNPDHDVVFALSRER